MTYVTCPTVRYHPAVVVAQKAATVALLSGDRFTLGLGAGENLNEHVVGRNWPPVNVRHEMLAEALDIITALFDGGYVTYRGTLFHVDSARVWDLPDRRVPIGVAVSGQQSINMFAALADVMIATEPDEALAPAWDAARSGLASRKVGQLPISWDSDAEAAVARAQEQFRWFAGGWKVNSELPGTAGFAAAGQFVRPEEVASQIPVATPSTRWSRRCVHSSGPGSEVRWYRSVQTPRPASSPRRRRNCFPRWRRPSAEPPFSPADECGR